MLTRPLLTAVNLLDKYLNQTFVGESVRQFVTQLVLTNFR